MSRRDELGRLAQLACDDGWGGWPRCDAPSTADWLVDCAGPARLKSRDAVLDVLESYICAGIDSVEAGMRLYALLDAEVAP